MPSGLGGEAAATPLREAKASLARARRYRLSYRLYAMAATLSALALFAAVLSSSALMAMFVGLATTLHTALALVQRTRTGRATADANEALDRAWLIAAEDATSHTKKGITVAELASRLKIDAVKAEKLLTQLAGHDRTRIDVDDDAEVRYSIAPETDTSKVRVASSEDQFRALEEAEAHAAESAAEAAGGDKPARQMTAEEESNDPTRVPFPRGSSR